jgi:mycofactocin precursor
MSRRGGPCDVAAARADLGKRCPAARARRPDAGLWIAEIPGGSPRGAQSHPRKEQHLEKIETVEETLEQGPASEQETEEPGIVDDICVEELAIDGICGVY